MLVKRKIARKTARMEFRVTQSSKAVIERAANISGLTPADLAYEAARRILEAHERFSLQAEDQTVFVNALINPAAPNRQLLDAFKRHARLVQSNSL